MKKYTTNCVNSSAAVLDPMLEKAEEINFEQFIQENRYHRASASVPVLRLERQ